jgi:hypothetical protein
MTRGPVSRGVLVPNRLDTAALDFYSGCVHGVTIPATGVANMKVKTKIKAGAAKQIAFDQ